MVSVSIRAGALCLVTASLLSSSSDPRPATAPAQIARQRETPAEMPTPSVEDLQRRGTVTFLMGHSAASHFLYRGEQMGFEYELAQRFAKELGIELEIVTPPPDEELTEWLKMGKGDIVAGLVTTYASDMDPLYLSTPYLTTSA